MTMFERLHRAEICCEQNAERIAELTSVSEQVSSFYVPFRYDNEWDRFEEFSVNGSGGSPPDNNLVLTTDVGTGSVLATGGSITDDARFLLLDDIELHNSQVHVDYSLSDNDVIFGVALRVTDTAAVVVWNDNTTGWTTDLQSGVWEYTGNSLSAMNPGANELALVDQRILLAEGDGSTVVVDTPTPHLLDPDGEEVRLDFGPFVNSLFTATPITSTTFEVSSAEVGTWAEGDGNWAQRDAEPVVDRVRRMAVRLIDDRVIFKHWRPYDAEPNWADPLRSTSNLLPIDAPQDGRVGIVAAFLGDGNSLTVSDLVVTPINGVVVDV